jgi:transcription elongation factor Elf1
MSLLIDHTYVSRLAPRLSHFKKKNERLYNFRCVFCGDSQKSKYKTRGYIYQNKDHLSFKCHNCNMSCSLDHLLQFVDVSLHKEYRLEKYREKSGKANTTFIIKNEMTNEEVKHVPFDLPRLSELPKGNSAVQYANSRRLPKDRWNDLYYCDNMKKMEYLNPAYEGRLPEDERLVLPFRNRDGRLTGITGRSLNPANKMRYMTVRIGEDPLVYGLDVADFSKKIYITEGQFDSMFVENAIAPGGTDFGRAVKQLPSSNIVLIFDNQPRNKQVVSKIEGMAAQGYSMVIWGNELQEKDINEAIMNGMTKSELMYIIDKRTFSGLELKLAIRDWKRV